MGCVPRKQPFILAPPTVTVHAQTAPQIAVTLQTDEDRRQINKGRTIVMTHRSVVRRLAGMSVATLILAASAAPTMAQEK